MRGHWNTEGPVSSARSLIAEAAQRRDWRAAKEAFDGAELLATPVWEAILHAADRCEMLEDAEDLFRRMQADRAVALRARAFTSVINLNSRRGNVNRVRQLLAEAQAEGVRLDAMLYSAVLNGYARAGNTEAALSAWQQMLDAGVQPTSVSFVSLLNVLAGARAPDAAAARLEEMASYGLRPEVVHWNAVLKACRRVPDGAAAQRYLKEMKERGVAPNIVSYTTAFLALAAHGDQSQCRALLDSMAADGVEPDGHLLEVRAVACLGSDRTENAVLGLASASREQLEAAAAALREGRALGLELSARAERLQSAVEESLAGLAPARALGAAAGGGDDWVEVQTATEDVYFWNRATGVTQWERPPTKSMPRVSA